MSAFASEFVQKIDPQVLPQEIIPDFTDDDNITKDISEGNPNPTVVCEVSIYSGLVPAQMEVIGGGLPMPIHSFTRPYSVYFNSNLMQNLYITANVSANTCTNCIRIYDERTRE